MNRWIATALHRLAAAITAYATAFEAAQQCVDNSAHAATGRGAVRAHRPLDDLQGRP